MAGRVSLLGRRKLVHLPHDLLDCKARGTGMCPPSASRFLSDYPRLRGFRPPGLVGVLPVEVSRYPQAKCKTQRAEQRHASDPMPEHSDERNDGEEGEEVCGDSLGCKGGNRISIYSMMQAA